MSNQQTMFAIIGSLVGQRNVLTIPRVFIDLADGDLHTALLLSQCVYWSDKGKSEYFYKSDAEWHEELGITSYRIRAAKKALTEKGFIDTKLKRANNAPTTHYRVNQQAIVEALTAQVSPDPPDLSKVDETDLSKVDETESAKVNQSITETTTETTTDSPGAPAPTPEPQKRTRKPDVLFDAVAERLFRAAPGTPEVEAVAGRVGKVKRALHTANATLGEFEAACQWWTATKRIDLPRDAEKVVSMVLEYRADRPTPNAPHYLDGTSRADAVAAAEAYMQEFAA